MHNTILVEIKDDVATVRINLEQLKVIRYALSRLEGDRHAEAIGNALESPMQEYEQQAFSEHLKEASEIVKSWPAWKRNVLGGLSR